MTISSELHNLLPGRDLPGFLPENKLLPIGIAFLCILVATRLISGARGGSKRTPNGSTPPMPPYWLPFLGHIYGFLFNSESFLKWARRTYTDGVFSLNLGGTTHTIIFKPDLSGVFMNIKTEIGDFEHISKRLSITNFGFPASEAEKYDEVLPELLAAYKHITTNPGLSNLVDATIAALKSNINDLVSFSESIVDQPQWERMANTYVVSKPDGEQVVEASLMALTRNFIAITATPAFFGSDFVSNFPDYWKNLWNMDSAFGYLATGLPRWVPIPKLTRGHIALRNMLQAQSQLETALEQEASGEDPGADWSHLDDVGDLIKSRMSIYRNHGISIRARASFEAALSWAMNANANPAVFWMLNHIYSDLTLLDALRKEVAPYIHVARPKQEFAIPELPRLEHVDMEGLDTRCPLLKSAYIETLRHDVASWSPKLMRQDYTLSSKDKSVEKFLLKKGTYTHIAHELHHKDPAYWIEPEVWKADRHVIYKTNDNGEKHKTAEMGTVRAYGKSLMYTIVEILILMTFFNRRRT